MQPFQPRFDVEFGGMLNNIGDQSEGTFRCPFCNSGKGFSTNAVDAIPKSLMPYRRVILVENENFFVIPDISPLCELHLLIISKRHYSSFSKIPTAFMKDLETMKTLVKNKVG